MVPAFYRYAVVVSKFSNLCFWLPAVNSTCLGNKLHWLVFWLCTMAPLGPNIASSRLLGLVSYTVTISDLLTNLLCQQLQCAALTLQFVCLLRCLAYLSLIWVHNWTLKCSDCLQCKVWVSDVSCSLIGDSAARLHFMGVCTVQVQLPAPVGYFPAEFLTSGAAFLTCSAYFTCLAAHQ